MKEIQEYLETKKLDLHLIMESVSYKYYSYNPSIEMAMRKVMSSYETIKNKIKLFEKDVWFAGLQTMVRESSSRGMRADANGIAVLTYKLAGRAIVNIERDMVSITLAGDDTSSTSCMGLHGLLATEEEAVRLLKDATSLWSEKALTFKPDSKVIYV